MKFTTFVFSPFQENTYVLYDETGECVIVDAGNFSARENSQLSQFIAENNLTPVKLINTHNHLDHLFGSRYIAETYKIPFACHPDDVFLANLYRQTCSAYGLMVENDCAQPTETFQDNDEIKFGNTTLKVIHVPGHSPGGVAFYVANDNLLFCGDILFYGSVGRTDLPGGSHEQLISGIQTKLLSLPDSTKVLSGHGQSSTIGFEKAHNPYL